MLINADVGECGFEVDTKIMPYVNMASIACGGHTGDQASIVATVNLAKKYKVKIGAHLSYVDKENFGRISQNISTYKLAAQLKTQLQHLEKVCYGQQLHISYIKPHGALYHDILRSLDKFKLVLNLSTTLQTAKLVVQFGLIDELRKQLAKQNNVRLLTEVFADRAYENDGINLHPRSEKASVFDNADAIKNQFNHLKSSAKADTICFHSDNPASIKALTAL